WPDAVAASGYAASTGQPILLATQDQLPDDTRAALAGSQVTEATLVGGTAALSEDVYESVNAEVETAARVSGATRYATSVEVTARHVDEERANWLWLATGTDFADALAAGPAAAATGGALLLVDGSDPGGGAESFSWMESHRDNIGRVVLVGGEE